MGYFWVNSVALWLVNVKEFKSSFSDFLRLDIFFLVSFLNINTSLVCYKKRKRKKKKKRDWESLW